MCHSEVTCYSKDVGDYLKTGKLFTLYSNLKVVYKTM